MNIFSYGHLYVLFGKIPIQIHCSLLSWFAYNSVIELYEFFMYFSILTPYQMYDLQISSAVQHIALAFCWLFPLLCRSFQFEVVPFVLAFEVIHKQHY